MTCVAFSIKFAKTNQKFAENSEFCEKNSLLLVNYSLHSLGCRGRDRRRRRERVASAQPLRRLRRARRRAAADAGQRLSGADRGRSAKEGE